MRSGALVRPLRAAGLIVTALAALVVTTGAAAAAPAAPAVPPGPVTGLALTGQGGEGARVLYFGARWAPPAETGGGTGLHYTYDVRDALGRPVDAGSTEQTTAGRFSADRCAQPYTIAVRAVTTDPATGRPLTGPGSTATLGRTSCEINSSMTATQTGPGTVRVDIAREAPVDPYVAGDCVLTADGRQVWTGTCGGNDGETAVVDGLAPGAHELVLTTRSPNGQDYVARTSVTVT